MDAYIDLQNFCTYLSSMSHQDFQEINNVLLANFDLKFTFTQQDLLRTAKKDIKRNFETWIRFATKNRNGRGNEWNVAYPARPVDDSIFRVEPPRLSALYMLSGDEISQIAEKGCLLIARNGDELDILRNLRVNDKFIPTKKYRIRDMHDWSIVRENASPCTDIIIVDQYLFLQQEIEYEDNVYSILDNLCRWTNGYPINIVFFAFNAGVDSGVSYSVPVPTIIRNLKERLERLTGTVPNITFVKLPAHMQHDRTIVTNYKMITSGDSFKYFRGGSNISMCSHGEWMDVSSFYDVDVFSNALAFLDDIQVILDDAKKRLMDIQGDKKSNYLRF